MSGAVRPEALAAHVAAASRRDGAARVLLLDVDGTLAPIAPRPEGARIPPTALDALDRLSETGWRTALVSGRPAAEVTGLAGDRAVSIFGSHGIETPGVPFESDPAVGERLATLAESLERIADAWSGVYVERKPAGLAIHDRAVNGGRVGAWRRTLRRTLAQTDLSGLELLDGRRVVELRLAGAHKGRVVEAWPPANLAAPDDPTVVAAGDDVTDEDLFAALGPGATTIRVGASPAPSRARWRLRSPDAVRRFLEALGRFSARGSV